MKNSDVIYCTYVMGTSRQLNAADAFKWPLK